VIVGLQVGDATRAVLYFERSAYVDLDDNQGNTAGACTSPPPGRGMSRCTVSGACAGAVGG
jgi:hypothetical protein